MIIIIFLLTMEWRPAKRLVTNTTKMHTGHNQEYININKLEDLGLLGYP